MDDLIFDRTASDVASRARKAYHMAEDLNRIEEWTAYLRDLLYSYGYSVSIAVKTDWLKSGGYVMNEINRIRANIDALQTGFYTLPDRLDIVYSNTLDFNQANAMEWDLHAIDVWLGRMVAAFVYAGEIYGGEV